MIIDLSKEKKMNFYTLILMIMIRKISIQVYFYINGNLMNLLNIKIESALYIFPGKN